MRAARRTATNDRGLKRHDIPDRHGVACVESVASNVSLSGPMKLRSSRPFWPMRDGLPATYPPLESDVRCEGAIIGGGISGA